MEYADGDEAEGGSGEAGADGGDDNPEVLIGPSFLAPFASFEPLATSVEGLSGVGCCSSEVSPLLSSGAMVVGDVCVDFPWVVLPSFFVNSRSLSTSRLNVSFSESRRSLQDPPSEFKLADTDTEALHSG